MPLPEERLEAEAQRWAEKLDAEALQRFRQHVEDVTARRAPLAEEAQLKRVLDRAVEIKEAK